MFLIRHAGAFCIQQFKCVDQIFPCVGRLYDQIHITSFRSRENARLQRIIFFGFFSGDVMSDMVSSAFGSLAMMTSVLVSPTGVYEYEAAHGTVQRHYYKHLKGEETSTNSVATIFAWTGALRKRGELDKIGALVEFADKLEKATLKTIEDGKMTKDLALITSLKDVTVLNSEDFIKTVRATFDAI